MKTKIFSSIATIPLIMAGIVTNANVVSAATIGSRIDFSGFVFGSSNQLDYIDSSVLIPNPNVPGNFTINNATGSFAPALGKQGTILDVHEGYSLGLITQSGPLFNGSDNPNLYVNDFLSFNVPSLVNFSFQLKTVDRVVAIDPNSPNPLDPLILSFSSILRGTLIDSITNEVQTAVATFVPQIPPSVIPLSQLTPDNFLGPVVYHGSLRVVSVPESNSNAGLALVVGIGFTFMLRKKQS